MTNVNTPVSGGQESIAIRCSTPTLWQAFKMVWVGCFLSNFRTYGLTLGVISAILAIFDAPSGALFFLGVGVVLALGFYTVWALYRAWKVRSFHRKHRHYWVIDGDFLTYHEEDGSSSQTPFKRITKAQVTRSAFILRSDRGGSVQYDFSDFSSEEDRRAFADILRRQGLLRP